MALLTISLQSTLTSIISLDQFNGFMETLHLLSSPANVRHLEKTINQYKSGQTETHQLLDDKKTLKRSNKLIKDALRTPYDGIGKPEEFKNNLSGYWSRRIDEKNRLVYTVDDTVLYIISCCYNYS